MRPLKSVIFSAIDAAEAQLASPEESGGRKLVGSLALALQGSLLLRHSSSAVAGAFLAARLGGEGGLVFGALAPGADVAGILARAWPAAA